MKFKWILSVLFIVGLLASCAPTRSQYGYGQPMYVYPGIGLGTIIAVVVSWSRNQSILWAIVHGILGWFYVIYAILVKPRNKV